MWENDLYDSMLTVLSSCLVLQNKSDEWFWAGEKSRCYSINSAYRAISYNVTYINKCFFKPFWNKITPLKVAVFFWKAILNRIPTKLNLMVRGVGGIESNLNCSLCNNH